MQKSTLHNAHSLAMMVFAVLLCAANSVFAYDRLFTHSHKPLTHHHHDHSGTHQHDDGVPLTNDNLPAHLVSPSSALIVTKMIAASHTVTYLPLFAFATIFFLPFVLYRPPIAPSGFKPPTTFWLVASLTLAPNSPPTI